MFGLELERRRRSGNTLPAKTTHLSRQKCQVEDSKYFPPKINFVCPLTAEQNPTHVTESGDGRTATNGFWLNFELSPRRFILPACACKQDAQQATTTKHTKQAEASSQNNQQTA
jgi:hypothetical protein